MTIPLGNVKPSWLFQTVGLSIRVRQDGDKDKDEDVWHLGYIWFLVINPVTSKRSIQKIKVNNNLTDKYLNEEEKTYTKKI